MATVSAAPTSGLDVNALVTGLMAIERQPITKLNAKEASYQAKLTALGMIKSKIDSFQTAVQALNSPNSGSLVAFKATSSDTTVVSASASSTAAAGTYSLEVTTLAQSQKLVAAGQASSTAAISDGIATTVTFDFGTISGGTLTGGIYSGATFTSNGGGTKSITIDGTNNTLQGIRDAINAAKMGVTASIVNDGSGTPYRLALSSDNSGLSNSLKITTSGGDGTIGTLLAYDPAGLPAAQHLNQTVASQNADFKVNGIAITKTSNSVTDAIQGVTLTLNKQVATATLTVARDTTAVSDSVSGFVKAYNDMYSALRNSAANKSGSALEGDLTLRTIQMQLRSIAGSAVSGGTMTMFSEAGLSFKVDGTLQLDSAKLDSAMSKDFNDVANLFNSATGFMTQFNQWATATLTADGTLTSHTDKINRSIKDIGTRRDALELRMTSLEKLYRRQYSSLNVMLSNMSQTSTYLSQQIAKM
ncbi:MAG: flagellar filament capping protein FliD [Nitrosomonadales bacterium]|nr:flagellar filament capping protein FliD [Nitrosomonadales bacterium]